MVFVQCSKIPGLAIHPQSQMGKMPTGRRGPPGSVSSHCRRQDAVLFGLIARFGIAGRAFVTAVAALGLDPPGIAAGPCDVEMADIAGRRNRVERPQAIADNAVLLLWIVRRAGGMAERKIGEGAARRVARLQDIERAAQTYRRDAGGFQVTGDQTHGLVANRSHRHQKHGVRMLALKCLQQ